MSLRWPSYLVMLAVLAGNSGLATAERLKVAIVPGIAVNLDTARVDALSQDLADGLRSVLDLEIVGGLEVRRRLPIAGLPPDCVALQACIDDVARRLDVQQLLFVVMVDTGSHGTVQVDTTWIDVRARKSASRPPIDIAALTTAKAQFADAAPQLLPDAPRRPEPAAPSLGRMSEAIPRHFALPSYVTAGVAVVGFGAGIVLGLQTRSEYNDCEAAANRGLPCSGSRKDSIRTRALIADAGWIVGLGGTIATAVLYATSGDAPHLIVGPTPEGVAITMAGTF